MVNGYLDNQLNRNIKFVSLLAFIFWYGALLIAVTLTVISLDRFLFIVKPLFYRRHIYMKPQIAVTVVIIVWIVCAILNSTPLYGLGRFQFSESRGQCGNHTILFIHCWYLLYFTAV